MYDYVIRANKNLFANIPLNIQVDEKQPETQPTQQTLHTLDDDLKASRLHPDQAFHKKNGATDQEVPTSLMNGTKGEEKEERKSRICFYYQLKAC